MLSEKETTRLSKLLSLVLRHDPARLGLTLDAQGWVGVDTLLAQAQKHRVPLDADTLRHIVETNAKQRFRFSDDGTKIRASQGHSVAVELGYAPAGPPAVLYHGTAERHRAAIERQGLQKMSRQHVHLSVDVPTALAVGRRHGKPVIFQVETGRMHAAGLPFYQADNGVWLTNHVPAEYLRAIE